MGQYIPKSTLVAEIEDWRDKITKGIFSIPLTGRDRAYATFEYEILGKVRDFIDTLEVKEISDKYDGFLGKELKMVDDEIERLEKLKVKEVDLEKAIDDYIYTHDSRKRLALELDWKCCNLTLKGGDEIIKFAKHFFELGLKAQKGE